MIIQVDGQWLRYVSRLMYTTTVSYQVMEYRDFCVRGDPDLFLDLKHRTTRIH